MLSVESLASARTGLSDLGFESDCGLRRPEADILWRPSCRSRKKVSCFSRGFGEAEFATDRFFNLFAVALVILREFVRGFTSFETFGDDVRAHACTCDNGAAKRNEGIDYDVFGLINIANARERIKAKGHAFCVPFDSTQMSLEQFANCQLSALRN